MQRSYTGSSWGNHIIPRLHKVTFPDFSFFLCMPGFQEPKFMIFVLLLKVCYNKNSFFFQCDHLVKRGNLFCIKPKRIEAMFSGTQTNSKSRSDSQNYF